MDFVEYGECPLGRDGAAKNARDSQKEDYDAARKYAEEGKFDDIESSMNIELEDIQLFYYHLLIIRYLYPTLFFSSLNC